MNGEPMTRQGLPTGQMEQETQELLDVYNESYCWDIMTWQISLRNMERKNLEITMKIIIEHHILTSGNINV